MTYLVYVHIGKSLPDYIYDNIYQALIVNNNESLIYVLIDQCLIDVFNENIRKLNIETTVVQAIPLQILSQDNINEYCSLMKDKFKNIENFRNNFWLSTTSRFFYIYEFIKLFKLHDVFHIENDVLIYYKLSDILENLIDVSKVNCVQDSPTRVIPSIMFFPNSEILKNLIDFILKNIKESNHFLNDMDILGKYQFKAILPFKSDMTKHMIFDGAAFGQYLGGVDTNNLPDNNNVLIKYKNPSIGFINETADVNATHYDFFRPFYIDEKTGLYMKKFMIKKNDKRKSHKLANLHIHSKQLYQFTNVFDITYDEIISGDRIISLADFVITTRQILLFHKNIEKYAKDTIMVKDFKNINLDAFHDILIEFCNIHQTSTIKLFIYTHILDDFIRYILPNIPEEIRLVLYIHNSDHALTDRHIDLFNGTANVKKVYAQNIDTHYRPNNLELLPIGLANSMWEHGDVISFFTVVKETYKYKKTNNVYVNINPNTYNYRKQLLDRAKKSFNISTGKPYSEYLIDLSTHYFCLCVRGNGLDTHRFWESLYLGVIPIIINDEHTKMNNFIYYLKKLEVPFYEIKDFNLKKYNDSFFDENLYMKILKQTKRHFLTIPQLKLNYYNS